MRAKGGKVTREPGPVKGGKSVIAFVEVGGGRPGAFKAPSKGGRSAIALWRWVGPHRGGLPGGRMGVTSCDGVRLGSHGLHPAQVPDVRFKNLVSGWVTTG